MYWWNVSKLAEDLREGRVTQKEQFKYFLATCAAWGLAVQLFLYTGIVLSAENLVCTTILLALTVLGIGLCYRINKSGDDADFVPRMICLGWLIGILVAVTYLAALLLLPLYPISPFDRDAAVRSESFMSAFSICVRRKWDSLAMMLLTFYFFLLGEVLARVAGAKGAKRHISYLLHVGGGIVIVMALGAILFFISGYVPDDKILLGLGCLLGLGIVLVRLSRSSSQRS